MKNMPRLMMLIAATYLPLAFGASQVSAQDAEASFKIAGAFSPCQRDILTSTFIDSVNRWLRRYDPNMVSNEGNTIHMKANYRRPLDIYLNVDGSRYEIFVKLSDGVVLKHSKAVEITQHIATGVRRQMGVVLDRIVPEICVPFQASDHESYATTGGGVVRGQAFLRQKGGGVVTCAGSQVNLLPATPYFREALIVVRSYLYSRQPIQSIPDEPARFIRTTTCDAQGNFEFTDVPAKPWIVMTAVNWSVGYEQQGGTLVGEVVVDDLRPASILMTDSNRFGH